MNSTHNTAYK